MKRLFLLSALAAIFAVAPMTSLSYVHAQDAHSDTENNMEQEADQEQNQEQWIADEPADMESSDSYEPESEEAPEPIE